MNHQPPTIEDCPTSPELFSQNSGQRCQTLPSTPVVETLESSTMLDLYPNHPTTLTSYPVYQQNYQYNDRLSTYEHPQNTIPLNAQYFMHQFPSGIATIHYLNDPQDVLMMDNTTDGSRMQSDSTLQEHIEMTPTVYSMTFDHEYQQFCNRVENVLQGIEQKSQILDDQIRATKTSMVPTPKEHQFNTYEEYLKATGRAPKYPWLGCCNSDRLHDDAKPSSLSEYYKRQCPGCDICQTLNKPQSRASSENQKPLTEVVHKLEQTNEGPRVEVHTSMKEQDPHLVKAKDNERTFETCTDEYEPCRTHNIIITINWTPKKRQKLGKDSYRRNTTSSESNDSSWEDVDSTDTENVRTARGKRKRKCRPVYKKQTLGQRKHPRPVGLKEPKIKTESVPDKKDIKSERNGSLTGTFQDPPVPNQKLPDTKAKRAKQRMRAAKDSTYKDKSSSSSSSPITSSPLNSPKIKLEKTNELSAVPKPSAKAEMRSSNTTQEVQGDSKKQQRTRATQLTREQVDRIVTLRKQGMTYAEIKKKMNLRVTLSTMRGRYMKALRALKSH